MKSFRFSAWCIDPRDRDQRPLNLPSQRGIQTKIFQFRIQLQDCQKMNENRRIYSEVDNFVVSDWWTSTCPVKIKKTKTGCIIFFRYQVPFDDGPMYDEQLQPQASSEASSSNCHKRQTNPITFTYALKCCKPPFSTQHDLGG